MQETAIRQLPDNDRQNEAEAAPLVPWLAGGLLAGAASGALALGAAIAGSAAFGLPWHRPLNVIASLDYGAHLAVSDALRQEWLAAALVYSAPAMLLAGIAYGVLVAALGFRPSKWLALKLGLLVGLSAWLLTVKAIAPVLSPLTVRLVPVWVTLALFTLFGVGLTVAVPVAARLSKLLAKPEPVERNDLYLPRRPPRVIPQ